MIARFSLSRFFLRRAPIVQRLAHWTLDPADFGSNPNRSYLYPRLGFGVPWRLRSFGQVKRSSRMEGGRVDPPGKRVIWRFDSQPTPPKCRRDVARLLADAA
ncbi:Hypothetical_protein [Hexamita inflata]|uniref:Hypothetical_protein n=1 Tax=Hexamita inflata TaxID=28002 RepID=A0AA86U245_9EUKA|nr:Hypothetical protein HINF_LOCUS24781 [Hexamita inflata]